MHVDEEIRLGGEPDAVPRARRFVKSVLSGLHLEDFDESVHDAQLVVTELVTNALLHARPPITVRVRMNGNGLRLEVADPVRSGPVRPLVSTEAMTGRGLALVDALTSRWGIDAAPAGKIVWAEIAPPGSVDPAVDNPVDIDALLAAWTDEPPDAEPRFTVSLGDVPTDLLLAAKSHVDNVVREFTLAAAGARSGAAAKVPPHLAELIRTVVHDFAEARQEIKRQALAAANAQAERTTLTLHLPQTAADAGEKYLEALDAADTYARAARLLTLESRPEHQAFRRWYVQSLVTQLRAAARGEALEARPQTLESRLLQEYGTVSAAHRASDRAARLQNVTAALGAATVPGDVASVVISEGVTALGASGGTLLQRGEDGHPIVPAAIGYPEELLAAIRAEDLSDDLPATVALRTGESIWLESRQERDARFPQLRGIEPNMVALCAVPLNVSDKTVGVLRFSFDGPRLFDEEERRFISALAAQTAQALDRASLYAAERAARAAAEDVAARLARLQRVTTELAAASDVNFVVDLIVTHLADAVGAEESSVCLLEDAETLRIERLRGGNDVVRHRLARHSIHDAAPTSEAVRTNAPVIVKNRDEYVARYPELATMVEATNLLVSLPLSMGEKRLGVVSLRFPPGRNLDDTQLAYLITLADTCAQALERANAMASAAEATAKLAFLADASAELSTSLDPATTLSNLADLIVPRLADWCSIQLVQDDELHTVAVAHADPAKVAWARSLQERYPSRLDDPAGPAQVIRSGQPLLYPDIPDDMIVASARDEEHLAVIREVGMSSAMAVPLTGRSGTFGAITLVQAESGRHFSEADLSLAGDLARRAAVAVETAQAFQTQRGKLAAMIRVAEAAQHAILAPVPSSVGAVRLSAAYVSAARDALVGGDLYEIVACPGAVRLLIGDVRGKGLDAVRLATVVLGHFRAAAVDEDDLADVARQIDARLRPYLQDEDFVTAAIVEIRDDGTCQVAVCGHPPVLHACNGELGTLGETGTLPLGLGAEPQVTSTVLQPGARLLLYTDGLLEARNADRSFVTIEDIVRPLHDAPVESALDAVLERLRAAAGSDLGDDLALLLAEYHPPSLGG